MKTAPAIVALLFGLTANGLSHAAELAELKVLYVGSEPPPTTSIS